MKSVAHIFGSPAKVRIMRLFIFNPGEYYLPAEVAKRSKTDSNRVRSTLRSLMSAGLIKKRVKGYSLNTSFKYLPALENFLMDVSPLSEKEVVQKLSKAGQIKLVSVSGIFLHDKDSRVDILVVGDNIKENKLERAISTLEAELGRELRYAAFETSDFNYRRGVYDKLIRDILDFRHKIILDKIGLEQSTGSKN